MYPKITSPCPFKFAKLPDGERNFCGQCNRTVHNLDGMCADERKAFVTNSSGKVCVAYTLQRPVASLGTTLGVGLALAVALSGAPNAYPSDASTVEVSTSSGQDSAAQQETLEDVQILGGTIASDATEWAEARDIQPLPALAADAPELEFVKAPGP
jgi:hypothetical protein